MYIITYFTEPANITHVCHHLLQRNFNTPIQTYLAFMQIATPGQCETVQKLDFNVLLPAQGHFRVKNPVTSTYIQCAHFQIFSNKNNYKTKHTHTNTKDSNTNFQRHSPFNIATVKKA